MAIPMRDEQRYAPLDNERDELHEAELAAAVEEDTPAGAPYQLDRAQTFALIHIGRALMVMNDRLADLKAAIDAGINQ